MSETNTHTARSSSRDAHSHRLRRVFCAGRADAACVLAMNSLHPSSPLMGEDRGEGEAIERFTPPPLTLTLSHEGRGNSPDRLTNGASAHV